jgi:hypothetical protein
MSLQREEQDPSPRSIHPGYRKVGIVLFSFFSLWMLWPVFTSVHIEAFSAALESMAIMINRHGNTGLALTDQAYPTYVEYLFMSRSGLVDALQLFQKIAGGFGDLGFRMLMIISMAVFAASCFSIVRRWNNVPIVLLMTALLLTPGISDIAFYFSDNLPSAALAMLSLAYIPREGQSELKWIAVGALFAGAVLIRFDAVLILPALGFGLCVQKPRVSQWISRAFCLAIGLAAVLIFAQIFTPYRLADAYQITKLFLNIHESAQDANRLRDVRVGFFGYAAPLLILIGVIQNWRANDWKWRCIWILLPALFYLAVIPKALETRMFLLLGAPALLLHTSSGISWILDQWTKEVAIGWKNALTWCTRIVSACGLAVILFAPVTLTMRDGPRTPVGRIWAPLIWREWQSRVDKGMSDLDTVVEGIQPNETILAISTYWNSDDYFRLRLLQHGFDIVPSSLLKGEYGNATEVFKKENRIVLHLRSKDPYGIMMLYGQPPFFTQALQVFSGLSTLSPSSYQRAFLLNWGPASVLFQPTLDRAGVIDDSAIFHKRLDLTPNEIDHLRPGKGKAQRVWEATFPQNPKIPCSSRARYGVINVQTLNPHQVDLLRRTAFYVVRDTSIKAKDWKPFTSVDQVHSTFAWMYGSPPK